MQEAELKSTHLSGRLLEEFDFASCQYESIGMEIEVGPKGVDGSHIFSAFFVTPSCMADPARAHHNMPAEWTDERKIIVSAIALKPIQDALDSILEPSLALGWPECIDRLRINLLWEYEGMEPVETHRRL